MTGMTVALAFVAGLFVVAWVLWFAALLITDLAHRLRGDVRCSAGCACRGNVAHEG